MPGPTQEATCAAPITPAPTVLQLVVTTWGLPMPTGTTKSKLCADKVLKIRSKLQSGFGPTHTPAPASPVGLLQVGKPTVTQSASVVHTLPTRGKAVHAVSCENNCELTCWKRWS